MTIIVPAYREAAHIREMVRQLAALDYPPARLDCVIACDGSPDRTPQLALEALASFPQARLRILDFPQNRGKVAVLNEMIAEARGDIVVLLDASSAIEPDFAREVARSFENTDVGVVCPGYALGPNAAPGEAAYWRYQQAIRIAEGAIAAPMGAHGAGYAFRKALWEQLPAGTINDDFVLPMRMVMGGTKAIYRPDLVVREREESARRRISAAGAVWARAISSRQFSARRSPGNAAGARPSCSCPARRCAV